MRIGKQVIGALCVGSLCEAFFGPEAAESLTTLANTAAIALENARLYTQAEKVVALEERSRIAAEIHDGLDQTLSYTGHNRINNMLSLFEEVTKTSSAIEVT